MTTAPEVAAYCQGKLGPGQIQDHLWYVQHSGLTVPILSFLHIGRPSIAGQNYGDLIYNSYPDCLLFSSGIFNPLGRPDVAAWPEQVARLKQNSAVKKIFLSVGGQGENNIFDFRTIEYMLNNGLRGVLEQNFFMLRQLFLTDEGDYAIDGIDLDCEEDVEPSTIVAFSSMLFELGFEVTFSPYQYPTLWEDYTRDLRAKGHTVTWWNVQCFDGGSPNRQLIRNWLNSLARVFGDSGAGSYLMPGLSVKGAVSGQCPTGQDGVEETFSQWRDNDLRLRGGFLWNYDIINESFPNRPCGDSPAALVDYVAAVRNGLTGTVWPRFGTGVCPRRRAPWAARSAGTTVHPPAHAAAAAERNGSADGRARGTTATRPASRSVIPGSSDHGPSSAGARSHLRAITASTITASAQANASPTQTREPPPKGK